MKKWPLSNIINMFFVSINALLGTVKVHSGTPACFRDEVLCIGNNSSFYENVVREGRHKQHHHSI